MLCKEQKIMKNTAETYLLIINYYHHLARYIDSLLSAMPLYPKFGQDKRKPAENVTAEDILPYFAKGVFINIEIYRQ